MRGWCPGKYRMISLTRTSQSPVKAEHGRSKYWEVSTGANSPLLSPLPRLSWSLMESDDDVSGEEEGQYTTVLTTVWLSTKPWGDLSDNWSPVNRGETETAATGPCKEGGRFLLWPHLSPLAFSPGLAGKIMLSKYEYSREFQYLLSSSHHIKILPCNDN